MAGEVRTPFRNSPFSDPVYTFSVPRDQTVYGIVDMMSHVFEQYFHVTPNTPLQDRMCDSVLRTVMETAPKLLEDLHSYPHRETILYCGTIALNKMLSMGTPGDWATHNIEHAVSAVYDIPHGGGLAILFPHWMKHTLDENVDRCHQLAIRVLMWTLPVSPKKRRHWKGSSACAVLVGSWCTLPSGRL